ncbi:microcephalin [Parambassis ranga]|uniref:Microcephalin n=1 Tax=Parambassis ranga TaxID=210632 RepID=A0A6P7JRV1_9TELE|nr:microcephalin [Parambassis ranga]XP_028279632.1 microcephalin [Parambassis ranga]XP_028279633.1 microcephalin [Parambassis ranga]
MTTTNNSSVLKDVVAYVDVWSSDKMANCSKPFVQQLQEMGAQVTKSFNKQVTHVVFNNGHLATWRKAKKSDVRLVSVLWVSKCHEDGMHVDEELYPALNDESNPVLKNKKHRCMQPKDTPVKTPENDRRMKKKLDKMMKDLAPKQPLVTDVSPIIIDEENGIVYSPAWKRSDYMAQRLKDMKDKRENLSPTASQMVESCSPPGLNPSLGSTPTVFKLMFNQSDDDSSASVAEPGCSPDKEEGRTHLDVGDLDHFQQSHTKDSMKPWLSSCHNVPESKQISAMSDCPDFTKKEDRKGNTQKMSRRTSVRRKAAEKHKSVDIESPCQDKSSKEFHKEKSQTASSSSLPDKSEKGKQKTAAAKSVTETKSRIYSDTLNPSSSVTLGVAQADMLKQAADPTQKMEQKTPKRARLSLSALVKSFSLSGESKSAALDTTDGDEDVFEDYFSPANHLQRSKRQLLPNLPVGNDLQIPFELDPVPVKRKQRRSESFETKKKRKLDESQSGKNVHHQQSDARNKPHQADVKESLPVLDSLSTDVTLMNKRRRQSTLAFTCTTKTASDTLKRRRSSSLVQSREDKAELQENSDFDVLSHTLKSKGNECTVTAGFTEVPSEAEENPNRQVSVCLQKMVNKTTAMRTLVMTSLPTEKQHTVIQVVESLGGFAIVDQVCESTTHVVSGEPRRTLNILLGIARGCWILSFEWILWCLEQRQWIPEEPYELSDHFPAAQICRLQRHLSAGEHQQDLFQGQPPMFVSQHSQPPTQSLVELIELCGGTVCRTVRQAGLCIGKYNGRRPEGSRILSEQWVLDSITHLKQLSYESYTLE